MPISKRKLAANRANAQKSTGPTSAAGLETSSQNRRTHGLCGKFVVLANESQEMFDELFAAFVEVEQPANPIEHELVLRMAQQRWLSNRAIGYQNACFTVQPTTEDNIQTRTRSVAVNAELDRFLRYLASSDRAYARAAAELARRKKARELEARGFESQKRAEAKQEQQKADREQREKRQQAEEKRREQQHQQKTELHSLRVAIAQADFELKAYKVFDRNPNFTPPGVLKSAA